MIITYHGSEFFKVQFGETVLAFNPISKESKLPQTRFGADIALVSLNTRDYNGIEQVTHGDRTPFAIVGPGEYEVKGVFIKGVPSKSLEGGEERINTIYSVTLENMNLCFLGALGAELSSDAKGAIDDIDILFVPIGGDGVLSPAEAYKLAVALEPKLIIPMHYGEAGSKELKTFLKEAGEEGVKPVDKLTLKKKDLEGKEAEVVVLDRV